MKKGLWTVVLVNIDKQLYLTEIFHKTQRNSRTYTDTAHCELSFSSFLMKLTFNIPQRKTSHWAAKKPLAIGKLVYIRVSLAKTTFSRSLWKRFRSNKWKITLCINTSWVAGEASHFHFNIRWLRMERLIGNNGNPNETSVGDGFWIWFVFSSSPFARQ